MKALVLAMTLTFLSVTFSLQASAQQVPNFNGNYNVVPGQCNFVGIEKIQGAMVTNVTDSQGARLIILRLVGTKQTGDVTFRTQRSRVPNPALQTGSPIQWISTDVSIPQNAIALTNTIHDEYADGHTEMEAILQLQLTNKQLTFSANEGSSLQTICLFQRIN